MGTGMGWGPGMFGVQYGTIPDESSNGTMIGITRMKMPSAASASLQNGMESHTLVRGCRKHAQRRCGVRVCRVRWFCVRA